MRTVKATLDRELGCVEIHTLADWHIGDKHCDINSIKKLLQYIHDNKNAYVICNGDLMNNATKASVSDCYAEDIPPMEQLETVCELLSPIKDKILMITQGNHEARTWKQDGIDLTGLFAKQLGIYDRYVREGGVLFLRFGELIGERKEHHSDKYRRVCYTIYCTHGSGGGRKEGGKINRLAELASIVDVDCYIMSHTHSPACIRNNYFRIDLRNSSVAPVEKLFINSSARLDYGGYGETNSFKPQSKSTPILLLDGAKKDMRVKF